MNWNLSANKMQTISISSVKDIGTDTRDSEVKRYSFQYEIDGEWYSMDFHARTDEEAEDVMNLFNGQKLVVARETQVVCSECFGELVCLNCEDLAEGFLPPDNVPYFNQ